MRPSIRSNHKCTFLGTLCPNKNALSSVESRLLGAQFCCQRRWCCNAIFFRFEHKTSYICHNVDTQNVKVARRDRPHIKASYWCETFENLLHIDIAPVRRTLSGILQSKNWTTIFICINIYYIHIEKYSPKSYIVNFRTQIGSSQSEERTMVFTREKKVTFQSESRRMFFHVWEKWYVQSEATEVCEFRAKIPAFSCSLLSAASHTFEEKSFSQRVFSR